jgi:DNA adenine methylase
MSLVAAKKLRPLVKWHGGKTYLARRIISLFPPHEVYVEPFAGGLSVLLNKRPAREEVASDLNRGLIETYRAVQEHAGAMWERLGWLTYNGATFEDAKRRDEGDFDSDPVDRASNFVVRNRFSRGGLGKDFAWSDRLRGGQPGDVNAWETIVKDFPEVARRLKSVRFYNLPAVDVITSWESPETLVYADPPYVHETRTTRKAYDHEMTRDDHERLLVVLKETPSMVFLSGYRNDLYDTALAGWKRHEFDMPNHSGQGKSKQRRVECVWTNT